MGRYRQRLPVQERRYVALTDEDFRQANVKASQTIEISSFTEAASIPPEFFETPYYLAPAKGGEKVYALLRETLKRTGKVAVGSLVMRCRQHPCIIVGDERVMVLNTLRFAEELRSIEDLKLPPATAKSAKVSPSEVAMAEKLVDEMSVPWNPSAYHDTYREDLMKVIEQKVRKRQTHLLTPTEKGGRKEERPSAQVIDLMAVLKKSLEAHGGGAAPPRRAASSRRSSTTRRRSRA